MDFKDWFNFDGTLDKGEYTKRFLISLAGCILLGWIPVIGWLIAIALTVVFVAACIRRLRGLKKNPWLTLLIIIPIVGLIFAIWLAITD
jgi:uncharacterized membrane protein YhaH (DUF805 family)